MKFEKVMSEIEEGFNRIEQRLLGMDNEELRNDIKLLKLMYSEIEEERNILKQILEDIRNLMPL